MMDVSNPTDILSGNLTLMIMMVLMMMTMMVLMIMMDVSNEVHNSNQDEPTRVEKALK